jgi:phosphatidylglycerol:prolipoprotein diacylglycerol transferase
MRPILLEWRGYRVYSYPALLYVGLVLGTIAGNVVARRAGLDSARVFTATVLLTIPALVGSRLLFVATYWKVYRQQPRRIWRRSEGGAALQGGLLLAVAVSVPLLAAMRVPFLAFWDAATFTMLIGMVCTRFGCLLHGCCSGRSTTGPLGLYLPDHRGVRCRRIPMQLVEAAWALSVAIGAALLWSGRPFPGSIFMATVAAYALFRFAFEPLRDVQDRIGGIRVQRVVSAGLGTIAMGGFLIAWLARG